MHTLFHTQLKRNELLKTELSEKITIYFHSLVLSHQVLHCDGMFSFYLNLYPYLFLSACPEIKRSNSYLEINDNVTQVYHVQCLQENKS